MIRSRKARAECRADLAREAREARRVHGTNDDPPWFLSPAGIIVLAVLLFIVVSVG